MRSGDTGLLWSSTQSKAPSPLRFAGALQMVEPSLEESTITCATDYLQGLPSFYVLSPEVVGNQGPKLGL